MELGQVENHQHQSSQTTFMRTCFNGVNAMSGIGILSASYALSQGGWFGLIILFVMSVMCWYTGVLLGKCMNSHPLAKTYPDIGNIAFGYKGKVMVSLFLYCELYFILIELLILEGDNLYKLFPHMSIKLGNVKIQGRNGFIILAGLVILPTTWVRSLGLLAYISAGGVLSYIVLVVSVFCVGTNDRVGFHEGGQDVI
ncbi:hypothetical protein Scep_017355 [Stephania cephalantha]|uniref:Amino acid transporter transmembrane domain-containing protein n=1 Tax=Stephania cephalantha TaxID=152367 RepID=A0AAP0IPG4_9MAGN